jgi:hypothetical protein
MRGWAFETPELVFRPRIPEGPRVSDDLESAACWALRLYGRLSCATYKKVAWRSRWTWLDVVHAPGGVQ